MIDRVPDLALGFVRFWAVRGKVEPAVAEACVVHLETLRVEFARDARDPMKWAWGKRMFAALDAAAIDRADPDAVAAFVERYRAAHPPEEEGDGPGA